MILKSILIILVLLGITFTGMLIKLASDSRQMSVPSGLINGLLRPCPESPNCVSSDAPPEDLHYIAPLSITNDQQWESLLARLTAMAEVSLINREGDYAHFTFTTPILGFVDDVELHYRPINQQIAVRSASRVGYGDMNTNRKRIDTLSPLL